MMKKRLKLDRVWQATRQLSCDGTLIFGNRQGPLNQEGLDVNECKVPADCCSFLSRTKKLFDTMPFRLSLAFVIGAVVNLSVLVRINNLSKQADVYMVCLFATFLSWHAAIRCHKRTRSTMGGIMVLPMLISVGFVVAAVLLRKHLSFSALLSAAAFLFIRLSLTRESPREAFAAGGFILLFMVPLPEQISDVAVGSLQRFQAIMVAAVFEPLTGVSLTASGSLLRMQSGELIQITEQCSGIRSLLGLGVFSFYCCAVYGHHWAGYLVMVAFSTIVAAAGNFWRLVLSCVFQVGEYNYWSSAGGHSMLSVIVLLTGCVFMSLLSKGLVIPKTEPELPVINNCV